LGNTTPCRVTFLSTFELQ